MTTRYWNTTSTNLQNIHQNEYSSNLFRLDSRYPLLWEVVINHPPKDNIVECIKPQRGEKNEQDRLACYGVGQLIECGDSATNKTNKLPGRCHADDPAKLLSEHICLNTMNAEDDQEKACKQDRWRSRSTVAIL